MDNAVHPDDWLRAHADNPCVTAVADYMATHEMQPAGPLLLGYSGGADSTYLLLILRALKIDFEAVHMNHQLRDEAADDEAFCARFAAAWGVAFRSVRLPVVDARHRESIEMAARRLRLAYWQEQTKGNPDLAVVLGHQQDDCLETMLLRLVRGSNVGGLCGLKPTSVVAGVHILRPLLACGRAEIRERLRQWRVPYREDASNSSDDYERNRVRNHVLPVLSELTGGRTGLMNSWSHLAADAAFIDRYIVGELDGFSGDGLPQEWLKAQAPGLWSRLLRQWALRVTGEDIVLRGSRLRNIQDALGNEPAPGAILALNERWAICVGRRQLTLEPLTQPALLAHDWYWQREPTLLLPEIGVTLAAESLICPKRTDAMSDGEYFAPEALSDCLHVRSRRPGDRMTPFGATQDVRVKKLFQAVKPSVAERRRSCLVCHESGEILWIPGIRRAASGAVEAGAPAVRLSIQITQKGSV